MEQNFYIESEISNISKFNTNQEMQSHSTTTNNIKQSLKGSYIYDDLENKNTRETLNPPFQSEIIEINDPQNIETEEKIEQKIFYIDNKKNNIFDSNTKKEVTKEKVDEKNISNEKTTERKKAKKKFITKNGKKKNQKKYKPSRQDNDRAMFSRIVLNSYYYNKLSAIIKMNGKYKKKLRKFPHCLIAKISQIHNEKYLERTLKEIYEDDELYKKKKGKNELDSHYEVNLKIIEELTGDKYKEFRKASDFDKLLGMKYRDLIEEYLTSKDYEIKKNEIRGSKAKFDADKTIYFWENYIANSK